MGKRLHKSGRIMKGSAMRMTDIAKIAAGLSEAQREAVLSAEHLLGGAMQVWHAHTSTIKSIHKKGLCSKPDWRNLATETPLGQQVRDYLKENNHVE